MPYWNRQPNERIITCDGCGPRILGGTKSMGIGAVLWNEHDQPCETRKERVISPSATSNMAEFLAIELALKIACERDFGDERWVIYSDSEYTVNCWHSPEWVKKPHLVEIKRRWYELAAKIQWRVTVRWFDGKQNIEADIASREAIKNEDYEEK